MSSVVQLAGYAFVLYVSLRLLRWFLQKSPLDVIPGPPPDSWISGNATGVLGLESWGYQDRLVERYGSVFTWNGLLKKKCLYTFDTRALHSIFIKDQDIYIESPVFAKAFQLFLGPGLVATFGAQHRRQRKILNPLFSGKQMRGLTPIFTPIIHKLKDAISVRVADETREIDMVGWMGRAALELIGQGGLGHSFDTLTEDVVEDDFINSVKTYFSTQSQLPMLVRIMIPTMMKIGSRTFRRKVVEMLPEGPYQAMRRISDTITQRSQELINEKKKLLQEGDEATRQQVGERADIMSVLLRENMKASTNDRLTDEEVIAQVGTLAIAAMDTTSNTLARILYMLSMHTDCQEKLREELIRARDDGVGKLRDLGYDELVQLPYLDAVCRETLRVYSPVGGLGRVARKDTTLPLSTPVRCYDGTLIDSVPIKRGTAIFADFRSCNTNKELWGPDAREWKPERWLSPLPSALEDARIPGVYSNLMSFSGGSRACIGFKFSELEMKVVLSILIPAFSFELTDKPVTWNASAVSYPSVEGAKASLPLLVTRIRA
ncbi:cytochrome P450 [Lenzites betulinus]|nr:cytochrome P450 [Lenzites betulinus]